MRQGQGSAPGRPSSSSSGLFSSYHFDGGEIDQPFSSSERVAEKGTGSVNEAETIAFRGRRAFFFLVNRSSK
jgi:hypothetical protein